MADLTQGLMQPMRKSLPNAANPRLLINLDRRPRRDKIVEGMVIIGSVVAISLGFLVELLRTA